MLNKIYNYLLNKFVQHFEGGYISYRLYPLQLLNQNVEICTSHIHISSQFRCLGI